MRPFLAGLVQLIFVSAALAQAVGDVESVGYEHAYRAGCWTPMVVRLTPTTAENFKGKIAVYQDDLDHDHAIFTREVNLGGKGEAGAAGGVDRTTKFWMYFIPQPRLDEDPKHNLRVYLTTEDGKQIARLPMNDPLISIDDQNSGHGTKLILCVVDQSRPIFAPYTRQALGLKEDVDPIQIPISNVTNLLPESVLGYESVDAVCWFDADPAALSPAQRRALEEYVRRGGKLVVCQSTRPNVWQMVSRKADQQGLGNLLPVDVLAIEKTDDLKPLKRIVDNGASTASIDPAKRPKWKDVGAGPYDIATAKAKPLSVVAETEGPDNTGRPWLVRGTFGTGSVTWVAQDLGDGVLTSRTGVEGTKEATEDYKWMYVWDRVMDWGNISQPSSESLISPSFKFRFQGATGSYPLGKNFLAAMEFGNRSVAFLSLSILLFIIYWLVAGPGSYLYLAGRKRKGASWFIFACAAIVATLGTALIVRLVLRGPPEIHHATFVRAAPGEPIIAHAMLGLYIPRDADERIALKDPSKGATSYLTAYPTLTATDEGASPVEYRIPVDDASVVSFPYRSTLKKMQARWVGDEPFTIAGAARVLADKTLEGTLTNRTGRALKSVYFVFSVDDGASPSRDAVLYVPMWDKDMTVDLNATWKTTKPIGKSADGSVPLKGWITRTGGSGWADYWYGELGYSQAETDSFSMPINFPMLSLFDHLAPMESSYGAGAGSRTELQRKSLRDLDVTPAISAGQLVILAQSAGDKEPTPVPVEVEGDVVGGEGLTYYQFIMPLDRSALTTPTTKPTTAPAGEKK